MKKLEFNIVDNKRLDVLDFSWYIDTIKAIYISRSQFNSALDPNYAIYVKTNFDLVELYYRTGDEIAISNQFKELCSAIKESNPNFEMCFPYLVNMEHVKVVDYTKNTLSGKIKIGFDEDELEIVTSKKFAKQFVEKFEEKNINFNQ